MNISKELAAQITSEIDEAVAAVLAKYELKRSKRRSTYGDFYRFTVEASAVVEGDNGVNVASPEAPAWIGNAYYMGFKNPEAALGKQFTFQGTTYTLTGMRPRARKFPITARRESDGKTYGLPESVISRIEGYDAGDVPAYTHALNA